MQQIPLQPVSAVQITILVDNLYDGLLLDQGPAKRFGFAGMSPLSVETMQDRRSFDLPQAQHGFAALVTVENAGHTHHVLFDTGATPDGLVQNMRRLSLPLKDIETVVLSHGHFDHTAGLAGLVRALGRAHLPLLMHPDFWHRRRVLVPGADPLELPTTSKSALQGAGFEIVEERQPSFLLDGALLVTGEVERTTAFERGMPGQEAWRQGAWLPDPLILDDQAIVLHVQGKGLVILTGCGHSGVVNIVRHVSRLTGISQIYAVIGGFHLNGPAFEPLIPATVQALAAAAPQVIVPTHCTGFRAIQQLALQLPDAFIQSSVGTRFEL